MVTSRQAADVDSSKVLLWQHRLGAVVLGVTVVLLPLLLIPAGWDPFRFPKVLLVRSSALLLMSLHLTAAIWCGMAGAWSAISSDRLNQVIIFVAGWSTIAVVASPDRTVSFWALGDVVAAFTLFLAARSHARAFGWSTLRWVMVFPAIVTTAVLVLQTSNVWHPLVTGEQFEALPWQDRGLLSKAAFLGNRDDVGVYLLIPFAIMVARGDRSRAALAVAVLLLAGVVLTTTFTAIAVAGVLVLILVLRTSSKEIRWAGVALLMTAGVGFLSIGTADRDVSWRIARYSKAIEEGDAYQLSGGRTNPFLVAASSVLSDPLFGVGPGRFPLIYKDRAMEMVRNERIGFQPDGIYYDKVHNDYLEIACEAGAPALAGSLVLMAVYFIAWRRCRGIESGLVGWGAALVVAGVSLAAMIQFPLQIAAVYGTLAIAAGAELGSRERVNV